MTGLDPATFKLGRLPRGNDPRVPHLSALKMTVGAFNWPVLQPSVDNAATLPDFLGAMLNDQLGDCTAAGAGHLEQLCSVSDGAAMVSVADDLVRQFYSECSGYVPGDYSTDRGAVMQDVLRHWLNVGFPMTDGSRSKIEAYVEVDPRQITDVLEVIQEFGAAYLGFIVPTGFMPPHNVWDLDPSYGAQEGAHCVIAHGYDWAAQEIKVTSWGTKQWRMKVSFWNRYVDECYGVLLPSWTGPDGRSPYGMSADDLRGLMSALRA